MSPIGYLAAVAAVVLSTSCNPSFRFQWNEGEEYGTYYPAEFRKLDFPENGKGFSASDGTAELWADTYYLYSLDELPADFPAEVRQTVEEEGLIGAAACLQGQTGPMTVSDTVVKNDGICERRKTVAYKDAFYTVSLSYPMDRSKYYEPYSTKIFATFPVLEPMIK